MKESDFWELDDGTVDMKEVKRLIEEDDADERADFCKGDLYSSIDIEGKQQ